MLETHLKKTLTWYIPSKDNRSYQCLKSEVRYLHSIALLSCIHQRKDTYQPMTLPSGCNTNQLKYSEWLESTMHPPQGLRLVSTWKKIESGVQGTFGEIHFHIHYFPSTVLLQSATSRLFLMFLWSQNECQRKDNMVKPCHSGVV